MPYLHFGHSSVVILPSGCLKEVRRGALVHSKIPTPFIWSTYEEWITFAANLTIPYSFGISWHTDAQWLAQWFRSSTLHTKNPKQMEAWNAVCQNIQALREAFMKRPTDKIRDELHHYEDLYANMYNTSKKMHLSTTVQPKMMVQDQYGYLHGLYMCLETGQIAADSADNVGHSFAELGIQPTAMYNREFGVYYRVF